MIKRFLILFVALFLTLGLTACGGGGGDAGSGPASSSSIQVEGAVVANPPVVGAMVTIYDSTGGIVVRATTGPGGIYSASLTGMVPFKVELTGGRLDYDGDGTGEVDFNGTLYSFIATSNQTFVPITSLTSLAYETAMAKARAADSKALMPTVAQIEAAKKNVRGAFSFGLDFDLFETPPVVTSEAAGDDALLQQAQNYRYANDAFTDIVTNSLAKDVTGGAVSESSPVLNDYIEALGEDLSDGVIDGSTAAGVAPSHTLTTINTVLGVGGIGPAMDGYVSTVSYASVAGAMTAESDATIGYIVAAPITEPAGLSATVDTNPPAELALAFAPATAEAGQTVPVTIKAMLKNAKGGAVAGKTISFIKATGAGTLLASNAITNDMGSASVKYTPAGDESIADTAIFRASLPNSSLSNTATIIFTATEDVNDAPVVEDIPDQSIAEGLAFATIRLDDYVSDSDDTDAAINWTYSGNNKLIVSIDKSWVATITIPDPNWNGSETITFRATDSGKFFDEDAAVFTVTAVNDAPVVSDIPDQSVSESSGFKTVKLDDYVSDVDNADAEISWTYSGNKLLSVSIDENHLAAVTVPGPNWNGSETITFIATDRDLLFSENAVTFSVTALNDPPEVSDIPDQSVSEGSSFATINLNDYVTDVDNTDAEISWVYSGNKELSVNIDANRVATIKIPNSNWNGIETITFRATNTDLLFDEDTVVFTVTAVNDAPVVSDIPDQTVAEGSTFATISLDDYVNDIDDTDAEITWTFSGNTELAVNIDANRVATITAPGPDWNGSESITFTAADIGALSAGNAAVFTVTAVNDAPVVGNIPDQSISEGEVFATINLDDYVTDIDNPDAEISWSYSGNNNLGVKIDGNRVATISAFDPNWNGSETITFWATNMGIYFDNNAAAFTVTAVNDVPSFTKGADQSIVKNAGAQTVVDWAGDVFAGPVNESGQSLSFNVIGNTNPELFSSGPTVSANGTLTYTPAADAGGSANVTIELQDNGGIADGGIDASPLQTFTITITAPESSKVLSVQHDNFYPTRLAQGPGGKIYVSDAKAGSVFIYDVDLNLTGELKNLSRPLGIAVDDAGHIYVGNNGRDNVEVYNTEGEKLYTIDDGNIQMPNDLVLDGLGNLYVADSLSNTIKVYTSGGQWITNIGGPGDGAGGLLFPVAITVGQDTGELYVADQGHGKVQVFDLNGSFSRSFGGAVAAFSGSWQGRFVKIQSLAFDGLGRLHAVDCYFNNVQIFDPFTGKNDKEIPYYGTYGSAPGELKLPLDILITQSGQVVVANSGNQRVEVIYTIP